jgi:hypothetical protein
MVADAGMVDKGKFNEYNARIMEGEVFPADFDLWGLSYEPSGWTLAHTAAKHGGLPDGFNQWDLCSKYGLMVAHIAAENGNLPVGFDRWELTAGCSGNTVAHAAAFNKLLPADFNQWELKNKYGYTVASLAALMEHPLFSSDGLDEPPAPSIKSSPSAA